MKPRFLGLTQAFFVLGVAFGLAGAHCSAQLTDYTYTTNNDSITITRYTGPGGLVLIPSAIYDLPVTRIGMWAFWRSTNMTSVKIPTSVTDIDSFAFDSCVGLTSLRIPDTVISIRNNAFTRCSSLTNVMIGKRVNSIGGTPFGNCDSLTAINVDPLNSFYSSLEGVLFDSNQTTLIEYPASKAGGYTIPNTVISIGDDAFNACARLTDVIVGDSVISIGNYAFNGCISLTNAAIGKYVTNILYWPFAGCRNLATISVDPLNSCFTSLQGGLFDIRSAMLLQYPAGKAGTYTIPNTVSSIGDWAFASCTNLASITIPNSVTNIRMGAFSGCSLTGISIPNSVTSIGDSAFIYCGNLTSITIPDSVTNLGGHAFQGCFNLTNAIIGNSVTSIGELAFYHCSNLANVMVGESVSSIGNLAFDMCFSLTTVTIGKSVTNIGDGAFGHCISLTALNFEGNAPNIPNNCGLCVSYDATVYRLPSTTGWGSTFGGRPTVLWKPRMEATDSSFGVWTNQFGFNITWARGMTVVVEVSSSLSNSTWSPVSTNTLTSGSSFFSEPLWPKYSARFYRLRTP